MSLLIPSRSSSMPIASRLRAALSRARTDVISAKYDAAQTSDRDSRHWTMADNLSADEANSLTVRKTLRERCRYEIGSNSYAKGMELAYAHAVIGRGPRLQLLDGSEDSRRKVEREWRRWMKAVRLAAKLRMQCFCDIHDGESFTVLTSDPDLASPVKLDLELIECDRVTDPLTLGVARPGYVDGVRLNERSKPTAYDVLRQHPGDGWTVNLGAYDTIPAQYVIHLFAQDRPGQHRGVPRMTAGCLMIFAQLRRWTGACLDAAEAAATFAGILKTQQPPDEEDDEMPWPTPTDTYQLNRGMLTVMPDTYSMEQVESKHPPAAFREFKRELLAEALRCILMPYNVGAGDSSGYNFSSTKADRQEWREAIRDLRDDRETEVLDRVFQAWMLEAIRLRDPSNPREPYIPLDVRALPSWNYTWTWDAPDPIDENQVATARDKNLRNFSTTLPLEYAERGLDFEDELAKHAAALGVTVDELRTLIRSSLYPGRAATPSPAADEPTEGERDRNAEARL